MNILHLTASPFFGGPERVILDIVRNQRPPEFDVNSTIVSFRENGNCQPFLNEVEKEGFTGLVLNRDFPHFFGAVSDLTKILKERNINIICAHGHKSRIIGWFAARRTGIPIIGVSHGWTWQDWKTSLYERLDQWFHRRMDKVVAVSQGQADKIIKSGTPKERVVVIHNAVDVSRFQKPFDLSKRKVLENYFTNETNKRNGNLTPRLFIGAAGRLSPEKDFSLMIDACFLLQQKCKENSLPENTFGFVLFGEGFLRKELQDQIDADNLNDIFKMPGFTSELDKFLPCFDIFAQSSLTEGFPCVNVEAMAAGVPIVATAVGGVPEQIRDGENGVLVEPENAFELADVLFRLINDKDLRHKMGKCGRETAQNEFTCQKQAE
ncbi:MAG: glycosyltransferase, partial [Planctomycetaceae bacterium]|nr:glycosyltransferase [Planctomycetaceae bacterium]